MTLRTYALSITAALGLPLAGYVAFHLLGASTPVTLIVTDPNPVKLEAQLKALQGRKVYYAIGNVGDVSTDDAVIVLQKYGAEGSLQRGPKTKQELQVSADNYTQSKGESTTTQIQL